MSGWEAGARKSWLMSTLAGVRHETDQDLLLRSSVRRAVRFEFDQDSVGRCRTAELLGDQAGSKEGPGPVIQALRQRKPVPTTSRRHRGHCRGDCLGNEPLP